MNTIKKFFLNLYTQLISINDTPHGIAFGFGIGVFFGILPGTGPLAALGATFIFKINKASTLLGCVITNGWLSVVSFVIAIKIGSALLGVDWRVVKDQAFSIFAHFSWKALFDVSVMSIVKPLLLGYLVVGIICGVIGYILARLALSFRK